MTNDLHSTDGMDQWDRVASELRACRESQQRAYGDLDNSLLGRWLAGEASTGEQAEVQTALDDHPELRQLTDLLKDVLGGLDPVSLDAPPLSVASPEPQVLPFRRPATKRKAGFWQKRAAVAAAACLLIALGAGLPAIGSPAAPSTFALAGGEASKDFGGLDRLPEAVRVAHAAPPPDPALRRKVFREVASLTSAGQEANKRGDILQATTKFREAQAVCQNHGIPERHPAALNAIQGEARIIQLALNESPAPLGDYAKSAPLDKKTVFGKATERLADEIEEKAVGDVRREEVPVLAHALRAASKADDKWKYAAALGKMGPAATPAVRTLVLSYADAKDPKVKDAALGALRDMGPSARQEMLFLMSDRPHPPMPPKHHFGPVGGGFGPGRGRTLTDAEKSKFREALSALSASHANVGVQDCAGRCSVRAARNGTHALRKLAPRIQVLVATIEPDAPNDAAARLATLGEKAVYVALCPENKKVSLHVSPALERAKFPVAEVAKALQAAFDAKGCDGAVAEIAAQMAALAK